MTPGGPYAFELPGGLTPEEERAVIAALERYFAEEAGPPPPSAWAVAGRIDAAGVGVLQARRIIRGPWRLAARSPFARRGVAPLRGRSDAS